ncbi:hypothetical protein CANARDRAFT_27445 [[Candida] arabinofermentans NRRL YB-2248]|uniref:Dihydroxyacetone kinase n=1 Tax=[Candida] arabinofermentans NRRL YB-2248 TaxID=983967 RepID=A0A1E4T365_9ASCO|nr:hypothetical protein CANARDRAFT_27445 [[Candida] arabinofermentans NRRL YB-2248]
MSSKHFLPKDPNKMVHQGLIAALYENPNLSLLAKERVIFNNKFDNSKVSLISGGGSGHEPGWYGFVCDGMLSASVQGDFFASPNYRNIQAAEKITHSEKGTIFLITNYTGDNLYFGMATQELVSMFGDDKIRILRVTDDVAVPRSKGALVGRRTLSGNTLVFKVLGACADEGHEIDDVYKLGESINANIASVNAGLDHVHIPTHDKSTNWGQLGPNELELGLGVHNEPGVQKLDYIPANEELIESMLKLLLDTTDPERGFFKYDSGDQIVLQMNNLGGVAHLEMLNLMYETLNQLNVRYGIQISRVYLGHFVTSFNAPIFTLTLFNVTKSVTTQFSEDKLFEYLDKIVDATNWPVNLHKKSGPIDVSSRIITNFEHYDEEKEAQKGIPSTNGSSKPVPDIIEEPELLNSIIKTAASNIIKKEPELTEWDTKMGDGDCGEGLKLGVEFILKKLEEEKFTQSGSVLITLKTILQIVKDDMGGTLGAILYIFLQGFTHKVETLLNEGLTDPTEVYTKAAGYAIDNLCEYTKAREGHRTVMDVLIPFCRTYQRTLSIDSAVKVALESAESTRKLEPLLGRATYVGIKAGSKDFPPDPGAYGVYEILAALVDH